MYEGPSLFDRARKVAPASVVRAHGGKLRRAGAKRSRGACPLCQSAEAFLADEAGPIWHCFSCGETGDSVALEMELGGHPDRTAAARVLAGEAERTNSSRGAFRTESKQSAGQREVVESTVVAAHIASVMVPARGTIVEAWLYARGIEVGHVGASLERLGFVARCPVSPWRVDRGHLAVQHAPAMIAALRKEPGGQIVGVHATYLSADGRAKADLGALPDGKARPSRKMWGQARHACCFLGDVRGAGPLVVGEGVETVLSYAADYVGSCRPIATLSLDNLQGRAVRDGEGVVPLWNLRSDPEAAPFLVADAGEVHLLIDADMRPIRLRCQLARRGRRDIHQIDGLQRAQICATLATQAWRRAGAGPVRSFRAPAGMDFNDLGRGA